MRKAFATRVVCLLIGLLLIVGDPAITAADPRVPPIFSEDIKDQDLGSVLHTASESCDEVHCEDEPDLAQVPRVCGDEIVPPAPFGTLDPAPVQCEQPGLAAEWFVAPGAFNMPQDVLLTPQAELLVLSVRSSEVFKVASDGTVTLLAEGVSAYSGDVDAQGNVYVYNDPAGLLYRITPDGTATLLVESSEIQTACSSGFGFGPDGNLYVALDPCEYPSRLMQITTDGEVALVSGAIEPLSALRTAPDGRFLAAGPWAVYELSLEDYSLTQLGSIPGSEPVSPGGLAVDDTGTIYVSTGSRSPRGAVYRMDAAGDVSLVAEIPLNGLSGIEWLPNTGEVVGGQLRQGGLIAVGSDGTLREIVPGNGLNSPMGMAFSPCGELAVASDDGGMMALVDSAGKVSWFFDYVSFTPPMPFVCFACDGTLYASEGCPSCPERVIMVPPGEVPRPYVESHMPSGLALRADGALLVAETSTGQITQINADQSTEVVAEGLEFPQALALDTGGDLFVVTGPDYFEPDAVFTVPSWGDTINRVDLEGRLTTIATLTAVSELAVGPSGDLFAPTVFGGTVVRVSPQGTVSSVVSGLRSAFGVAFDLAGNLYVSDSDFNGIARIGGFPQGTLSGTVSSAGGGPIEGARVQVVCDWPIVVGQVVTTSVEGRFSLPAAPRTYSVIVTAEGHEAMTVDDIEITADQETDLDIELEPRYELYLPLICKNCLGPTGIIGRVTDGSGNPIANINVNAGDYDLFVGCQGGAGFWVGTEASGAYRLDVPPGTYLVYVNSHNETGSYVPEAYSNVNSWRDIASAARVTVRRGELVAGVDFSLPVGFTVSGRLVDNQGQPILGAGANISDAAQGIEFSCALGFGSSDADGTFRVNVPAGTYDLYFGRGSEGYCVIRGLAVSDHTDLGDILFAEAH